MVDQPGTISWSGAENPASSAGVVSVRMGLRAPKEMQSGSSVAPSGPGRGEGREQEGECSERSKILPPPPLLGQTAGSDVKKRGSGSLWSSKLERSPN